MRPTTRTTRTATTALALGALAAAALVGPSVAYGGLRGDDSSGGDGRDKLTVVGLVGGTSLVTFDTNRPDRTSAPVAVTGLSGGDTGLIGIDYRVQDGKLYGVGNTGMAGIYAIDPATGVATELRRLTVALSGTSFGVDFNPAANALRIVSNDGQNLRQPLASPGALTVADAALNNGGVVALGVAGAAYTNNDLNASTATTLLDLNTAAVNDTVALQSPPNNGSLAATGSTGVDVAPDAGFDIYSTVRDGRTVANTAFAVSGGTLYAVDLLTGAATDEGALGAAVTDIAIPLDQL